MRLAEASIKQLKVDAIVLWIDKVSDQRNRPILCAKEVVDRS
jgi:hypothetical protein